MSKSEDVINRAYGHIVKEVNPIISFDITIFRGFKYYWYKLIRKAEQDIQVKKPQTWSVVDLI